MTEPTVTVAGASEAATAAPDSATAPRRWLLSPGFALLWLLSLVAVAAVAAGVTFAATWIPQIAQHGDARQIATLSPDPAFDWPKALGDRSPDMTSDGSEITISSVAARARVHRSFIHRHPDLHAAARAERWSDGMPTNLVLASGPSKTSDIQQTLAFGAHGPRWMWVIIVTEGGAQ